MALANPQQTWKPLNMDASVRRRRTRDHQPPRLPADLWGHVSSFIQLCDSNELRMRQVVDDLQHVSDKLQRLQLRSEKCNVVGIVAAAVGLGVAVAAITAQVPGGLSLALTAAAGYVAAAAAVVVFRAKQLTTEEKQVKKVKEFLDIVALLQSELENISELCDDLQRGAGGAETETVLSLRSNILMTEKLRSSIRSGLNSEFTDQCENVFDQFRSTKRKLEEFRGGDTESVQSVCE